VSRALLAGDAAVLLELDAGRPAALAAAVSQAAIPGVLAVIPAARTVLVTLEPGRCDVAELAGQLAGIRVPEVATASGPVTEIEVCYDGRDLAEVAALTGLPVAEVVGRHQQAEYEVGWLGFSPGFAYLTGLDPALAAVPRLASPRLAVPAGSVAIAGGMTAIYPAVSPGGWRLIGRTDAPLWDQERQPPALLAPGMRVRFRAVPELTGPEPGRPARSPAPASAVPATSASLEILQPGPLTTVQDLGRPGLAHLGVPHSGAADPGSLRLANALVGNEAGLAGLEVTLGRLAARFGVDATVAVAGAPAPVRVRAPDGREHEPPAGAAFEIAAGSVLRLGSPAAGLRSYLAVAGGIDVPPVLGSRSADLLSGLGPERLRAGQRRAIGPADRRARSAGQPVQAAAAGWPRAGSAHDPAELRAIAGPRADWFAADALDLLAQATYQVTAASDRTGLRLAGPPLRRASGAELASEGVATGSLQVAHDGQPILLLADHPVTGGYPVIAVVHSADIGAAGQLRPGQHVRFRLGFLSPGQSADGRQ
jgi:KipI family sensor histidine kinase inhibitor